MLCYQVSIGKIKHCECGGKKYEHISSISIEPSRKLTKEEERQIIQEIKEKFCIHSNNYDIRWSFDDDLRFETKTLIFKSDEGDEWHIDFHYMF